MLSKPVQDKYDADKSAVITQDFRPSVSARMRAVMHMVALGMSNQQIATNLGISTERVSAIKNSQSGKEQIKAIQDEFFMKEPQKLFLMMVPDAARTLKKVMDDDLEKGSTRISAADSILDRAMGKPKQEVQHEGSLIKELFMQLDQEKQPKTIEVEKIEEAEIVKDPMDAWAEENL